MIQAVARSVFDWYQAIGQVSGFYLWPFTRTFLRVRQEYVRVCITEVHHLNRIEFIDNIQRVPENGEFVCNKRLNNKKQDWSSFGLLSSISVCLCEKLTLWLAFPFKCWFHRCPANNLSSLAYCTFSFLNIWSFAFHSNWKSDFMSWMDAVMISLVGWKVYSIKLPTTCMIEKWTQVCFLPWSPAFLVSHNLCMGECFGNIWRVWNIFHKALSPAPPFDALQMA